ncbi:MAG: DUF438 domain-containing protein [Bryobacterales bacterium]|nr:DUF438 domain-containing protein [Bryobacterales bacterium]
MSELIDNRAHRVRTLKDIIKRLHGGESPDTVRGALRDIVQQTDYSEIVEMEQQLMAEGMPVEEVQCMCDLHSEVTREVLVPAPAPLVAPGHPADTLKRENDALRGAILRLRRAIGAIKGLDDDAPGGPALLEWRQAVNDLMDVDKHFQRKENAFFPCLERHGINGPSKVMWAKDDEIRQLVKALNEALTQTTATAGEWKVIADTLAATAIKQMEEMFYKEENILLPMCFGNFTDQEWSEIWAASPRYGWCLVEPGKGFKPVEAVLRETVRIERSQAVLLPTGHLDLKQLIGIFSTLPVDLTFVDADDRVAFFSEGPDRIFARSRAILGRKVQNCHPPKSVETVERILEDFRAGTQSVAEFWIQMHGKFVHVRYFAVRDEGGDYLGTLEVTQEVSRIRSLEGERRLLEYDQPGVAV